MNTRIDLHLRRAGFELRVDAEFAAGSVVAVLGPNGSGKSTLLRAIAGLEPLARGDVVINGRSVQSGTATTAPEDRHVGLVFQHYALFPHLSVLENVAFGLRARGMRAKVAREQAAAALTGLGIAQFAERLPRALSGGQAQRVAVARALVTDPDMLLLDEPMAALDAASRDVVRVALAEQLRSFRGCTLLVTHDPLDAMLLANRVLVLEHGRVVQDAAPAQLARQPATPYVAALMGTNLLRGTSADGRMALADGGTLAIADHALRGPALAAVRPSAVAVHLQPPQGSARNVWQGTVASLLQVHDRVRVLVEGQPSLSVEVTPEAVAELHLRPGSHVWLSVKATEIHTYPAPTTG